MTKLSNLFTYTSNNSLEVKDSINMLHTGIANAYSKGGHNKDTLNLMTDLLTELHADSFSEYVDEVKERK